MQFSEIGFTIFFLKAVLERCLKHISKGVFKNMCSLSRVGVIWRALECHASRKWGTLAVRLVGHTSGHTSAAAHLWQATPGVFKGLRPVHPEHVPRLRS